MLYYRLNMCGIHWGKIIYAAFILIHLYVCYIFFFFLLKIKLFINLLSQVKDDGGLLSSLQLRCSSFVLNNLYFRLKFDFNDCIDLMINSSLLLDG